MDDDEDHDFISPKQPPPAPKRPAIKKGDVHTKVPVIPAINTIEKAFSSKVDTIKINDEQNWTPITEIKKASNSDQHTCYVCNKSINHLSGVRRSLHVNECLDKQETKSNYKRDSEKYSSTIDCPMCGEPQAPGPHRAAHAKRCAKANNLSGHQLLNLMETQTKVAELRKKKSLPHTKAAVPVEKEVRAAKLANEPKSLLDEDVQLAKALSASSTEAENLNDSLAFTKLDDPNEKRRKRPRSYALVEFAPRTCKCDILTTIHSRFLDTFCVKKISSNKSESLKEVMERRADRVSQYAVYQAKILERLSRLETLSEELCKLSAKKEEDDVKIMCTNGILSANRGVVSVRTSLLHKKNAVPDGEMIKFDVSHEVASLWLRFVYSAKVEWMTEQNDAIAKLAEKYGPDDLPAVCSRMSQPSTSSHPLIVMISPSDGSIRFTSASATSSSGTPEKNDVEVVDTNKVTQREERASTSETPKTVSTLEAPSTSKSDTIVRIPACLEVNLDSSSKGSDTSGHDSNEDPLYGLNMNSSATLTMTDDDDCVIIEEKVAIERHTTVTPIKRSPAKMINSPPSKLTPLRQTQVPIPEPSTSPDLFEDPVDDDSLFHTFSAQFDDPTEAIGTSSENMLAESAPADGVLLGTETVNESEDAKEEPISSGTVTIEEDDDKNQEEMHSNDGEDINMPSPYFPDVNWGYDDRQADWESTSPYPAESTTWNEGKTKDEERKSQTEEKESTENKRENSVQLHTTPLSSSSSRRRSSKRSLTMDEFVETEEEPADSFFDSLIYCEPRKSDSVENSETGPSTSAPLAASTPKQPIRKKARFGSNVKILKTAGITPKPDFSAMDDIKLKLEMAKYGLRPAPRKRAIATLEKIYEQTHPLIDPNTPTIRPLVIEEEEDEVEDKVEDVKKKTKAAAAKTQAAEVVEKGKEEKKKRVVNKKTSVPVREATPEKVIPPPVFTSPTALNDSDDMGDKTLNDSRDEPLEESMIDDTGVLPKDLEGMQNTFMCWLRRPENNVLYNHLLALQPVVIDELHLRMTRSDSNVSMIPKKALASILDRLGVTFSLPQVAGGRRAMGKKTRK